MGTRYLQDFANCLQLILPSILRLNAKPQNPISNGFYFTAIPLAHLDGLKNGPSQAKGGRQFKQEGTSVCILNYPLTYD